MIGQPAVKAVLYTARIMPLCRDGRMINSCLNPCLLESTMHHGVWPAASLAQVVHHILRESITGVHRLAEMNKRACSLAGRCFQASPRSSSRACLRPFWSTAPVPLLQKSLRERFTTTTGEPAAACLNISCNLIVMCTAVFAESEALRASCGL